ncbi:MAG: redoxin domain-containing protein [Pedobacter sp.]|nr:MAG: redoxin domain-containing protein [Pedobacter sp.]
MFFKTISWQQLAFLNLTLQHFRQLTIFKEKNHKMKKIISLTLLLLASSIVFAQNFKIDGTVDGLENGTWLYLKLSSPQETIDSTQVTNGKFTLNGHLPLAATQVILHTQKYTNYVFFWLENKNITMSLKDKEFKNGVIKGSIAQTENEEIQKLIKPIGLKEDSLRVALSKTTDTTVKAEIRQQLNNIKPEEYAAYLSYTKNHPSSLIIANIVDVYSTTWGKEKTNEIYQLFTPTLQQTTYGKSINRFLSLSREIKIGGKYVDFEQTNTTGKKVKLSDIKGKYILLEFWGSWCGPCREENPVLVQTYNAYKAKGFEILGVAADENKAQWLTAIKDDGLLWENVTDLKGSKNEAGLIYNINSFPTNYLIDQNGIIIAKDLRGKKLADKLAELLP